MVATGNSDLQAEFERRGQGHVFRWESSLNTSERDGLLRQLSTIDLSEIESLWRKFQSSAAEDNDMGEIHPPSQIERLPQSAADHQRWSEAEVRGRELLAAGRVGVVLVAGGQGSRLGFPHPKGMFPIGPVTGHSLFQGFCEQLLAQSRRCGRELPYYIMTSDATHDETVAFFAEHDNFGLPAGSVHFFQQGNMPVVDAESGQLLMDAPGYLCVSPDGHGGTIQALSRAGLFNDMEARGIDLLFYHQVDNPCTRIVHPAILGFHALHESEATTLAIAKRSATEKMGVLVDQDSRLQIIEYSDLPTDRAAETDENGLRFWAGNTAIHIFSRTFLESFVERSLPFHLAHKATAHLGERGETVVPQKPNALKFERFIFDTLPFAKKTLVVEGDRATEFNPVKNKSGDDSPETARAALMTMYRQWLRDSGARVGDDVPVEISPLAALGAEEIDVPEGFVVEPGFVLGPAK